jgi:hypothetical protein
MTKLVASFEYSGMPDYWGGNGRRWDDDAGCIFASYDRGTTLRDIIDDAVSDFNSGGDCDSFPSDITDKDVRAALLDSLTSAGLADYHCGALADCAVEFANCNPMVCRECDAPLGDVHDDNCMFRDDLDDDEQESFYVEESDCADDDYCSDSPFVVFLLEVVEDND